jgi:hypothetical protein
MYLNIFIPTPETDNRRLGIPYNKSPQPWLIVEKEAEPYNKISYYHFIPFYLVEHMNNIDLSLTEELMFEE